jgi:hypothetical protein
VERRSVAAEHGRQSSNERGPGRAAAAGQLRELAGEKLRKARVEYHRTAVRLQNEFAIAEYKAQVQENERKLQAKEAVKRESLVEKAKAALSGLGKRLVGA